MGQMLNTFLPNRENPAISPISTTVKPFIGSLDSLMMQMERMVTRPELMRVAPTPAMYT